MSDLEHCRRAYCQKKRPASPPIRDFYMPAMPPLGLINWVKCVAKAWLKRRRFRQRFLPLLTYDDHILKDMGHMREDIEWALRLPLREDAYQALQCRQKECRLPTTKPKH